MPVLIENRQTVRRVNRVRIRRILTEMMTQLGCADQEVSVLLVDDAGIRTINRDYLGRDRPTNVISFALREGADGALNPHLLGDIVVSVETAVSDARRARIKFTDELDFLLIHGLLHLLGFDHEGVSSTKAGEMKALEQRIFYAFKGYEIQ